MSEASAQVVQRVGQDPASGISDTFLDQGVLGALVLVLLFALYKQQQKIHELQEKRVEQENKRVELAMTVVKTVDTVTNALDRNTEAIERGGKR